MVKASIAAPDQNGTDPFSDWKDEVIALDEMSEKSAVKYRPLWNAYRGWLINKACDWDKANASLIQEFLQGPAPGNGKRRRALNPSAMSTYTRQRYWRLLRGVYACAVKKKTIPNNPALDIGENQRPSIARKDRQSQILEPHVFERLCSPRTLNTIIQLSSADDWWHVRDRAIMAILCCTGITSSELIALRGVDVGPEDRKMANPTASFEWAAAAKSPLVIDIMMPGGKVGRTLTITPTMTAPVQEWIRRRTQLLTERGSHTVILADRAKFLKEHDQQGPFFVSRRKKNSANTLPAMEPVTLYYTVSQALMALRQQMGMNSNDSDAPYVAKGPAVIRNSVIRRWLDTLGTQETINRSGLQDEQSLRLWPRASLETPPK